MAAQPAARLARLAARVDALVPVRLGDPVEQATARIPCDSWVASDDPEADLLDLRCDGYSPAAAPGAAQGLKEEVVLRFHHGALWYAKWTRTGTWASDELLSETHQLSQWIRARIGDPNIDETEGPVEAAIERGEYHLQWALDRGQLTFYVGSRGVPGAYDLAVKLD